ncbi:MAG: transcription factor IIB [Thaumarchaeota archaeon]|nr:transcription factor IIB [Nitrososphaerota archaeon]
MTELEIPTCTECSSTALMDDTERGETVCQSCGIVVVDQMVDMGPETARSYDDKVGLARASGTMTYAQHDLGLSTKIASTGKDAGGNSIGSEMASTIKRIDKWNSRVRVSSNEDRRLVGMLTRLGEICRGMAFPENVLETASMIYRDLDTKAVKGRHIDSMAAATVYMACQRCEVVRSLEDICRGFCNPVDVRAKTKLAARYYRDMRLNMETSPSTSVTMDRRISQIANITKTDPRVERLALKISERTRGGGFAGGKTPQGIAAAYLYVASILRGQSVLQRDMSTVAQVTEVTIRARCKDLLMSYRLSVTLAPA